MSCHSVGDIIPQSIPTHNYTHLVPFVCKTKSLPNFYRQTFYQSIKSIYFSVLLALPLQVFPKKILHCSNRRIFIRAFRANSHPVSLLNSHTHNYHQLSSVRRPALCRQCNSGLVFPDLLYKHTCRRAWSPIVSVTVYSNVFISFLLRHFRFYSSGA